MKWIDELEKIQNPDPGDIEPMPELEIDETEYAKAKRQAIIDVDGGQVKPGVGPVEAVMNSKILGDGVNVIFSPDQAMVDGVVYTNDELKDLLGRGLPAADLREVHLVKQEFEGMVIPSKQATEIESYPITRW